MIADTAAIRVVGRDTQIGLVVEQAVDDIGGLSGRGYRDCVIWRLAGRKVRIKKRGSGALVMGVDRSDSFPRPGSREVLSIRAGHIGGTERGGERLALLGVNQDRERLAVGSYRLISRELGLSKNTVLEIVKRNRAMSA